MPGGNSLARPACNSSMSLCSSGTCRLSDLAVNACSQKAERNKFRRYRPRSLCAPCALSQSIIFFNKIAADLGDARGGIEIGEMSLSETEIAVEAVDQNFERVLQRLEMMLLVAGSFSAFRISFLLPDETSGDR